MSNFAQSEEGLREEARQLRDKLVEVKKKKEVQNNQQMREELNDIYNSKYEDFKRNVEKEYESQLASLELIKQFRLNEFSELQTKIRDCLLKLQKQEVLLEERKKQLDDSLDNAITCLNKQKEQSFQDLRKRMESELIEKVDNYRQSIEIE